MKLQIRSLRAINCGPLDDVCIDFCDASGKPQPITVLGGANGSGKTTVIELVVALCEMLDPGWDYVRMAPFVDKQRSILDRTQYAQLNMLITTSNEVPFDVCYGEPVEGAQLPSNYFCRGEKGYEQRYGSAVSESYQAIKQSIERQQFNPLFLSDGEETGSSIDPINAGSDLLPSILYFPVSRFLSRTEGKQVQREDTVYHWVYRYEPASTFEGSLDSYLIWLDYAEPERFRRVVEFLADLDIDGKRFDVQRKHLRAVVTTHDGKTHGLEELSSGEQHILIMLLELHRRLLPGSIVLIDEIENSLHPAFQYRLAQLLKRMQEAIPFQLIVTTHAPAFVEIFGSHSVRLLTEF
jgi:predicted ATP-binding protein involved in virulence